MAPKATQPKTAEQTWSSVPAEKELLGVAEDEAAPDDASPIKGSLDKLDLEKQAVVDTILLAPTTAHSAQQPITQCQWLGMTVFQLVYVGVTTNLGVLVLPVEAQRLHEHNASLWVSVYMGVAGVAQLVCPVVGKISDRHRSRWGRRRPFILGGCLVSLLCLVGMWLASDWRWQRTFVATLFPMQVSLNVIFAAQSGLPADFLGGDPSSNTSAKGLVSGYIATFTFMGALLGMVMVIATAGLPVNSAYLIYMAEIFLGCAVVCVSAREASTLAAPANGPLTLRELRRSFAIDLAEDLNFFWVCAGRLFYYMSTSVAVFMYFYFRDMLGVRDEAARRLQIGSLAIIMQVVGAFSSTPFSRLAAGMGQKPLIYVSCFLMTGTFCLYIMAPLLEDGGHAWLTIVAAAVCYGIGNGAYLSVDYALALDCLPRGKTAAEAFGLWGVIGFFGSTVGPIVGGALLSCSQEIGAAHDEYNFVGYALVMLVLGICMNVMVVFCTARIRKTKFLAV